MVGWHHRLNGRKFEQTPGVGDEQGSLACCSMGLQRVGHDRVTELNWTDWTVFLQLIHSGLVWVIINTLTAQTHGRVLSWNKMFMCMCVCVCVYETLFSAPNETHRPRVKKRRLLKGETRCNYQKKGVGLEDVFKKAILSGIYHNETLTRTTFHTWVR